MGKKLYVGNLSYEVDSSELEQLFRSDTDLVSPHNRIHSSPERPSARSIPTDELPT